MKTCEGILFYALSAVPAACGIALPARAAASDDKPKHAIDPSLKNVAEPVGLVAGGKRSGITSAQQVELDVAFDWEKIAKVKGLTSHVTFVNRSGDNASAKLLGDNIFQSQAVYGGTHHKLVHLVQAYFEDELDNGKWDVAAGRLPVGEAFATSPLYRSA
jgi:porin